MSDIIRKWLEKQLGIVINLRPETFCDLTRDGYFLSKVLRSYEIITEEQFETILKTDNREVCFDNFNSHVVNWLRKININLSNQDITDIVDCKGLASLSLFYRVFLKLLNNDCPTVVPKDKLRTRVSKNAFVKVREAPLQNVDTQPKEAVHRNVMNWLQDRFETVLDRCKAAREHFKQTKASVTTNELYNLRRKSIEDCRNTHHPNIPDVRYTLQRIREKLKRKAENELFRKELEEHVSNVVWSKIMVQNIEEPGDEIIDTVPNQSGYEKQLFRELQEEKQTRDLIIENKKIIWDKISQEREQHFVEQLLKKRSELDKNAYQYYLEKERTNRLHEALYKELLRIRKDRKLKLCSDTLKAISNAAVEYSEFTLYFGESPSKKVTDNWNKRIVTGESLEEPKIPSSSLIDDRAQIENIIHKSVQKRNVLNVKDVEDYLMFESPWALSNVDINDELVYDMNCGMNVLGRIVHLLLDEKYPLPAYPAPPDLPTVNVRVCVNGLPDATCLPMLKKLLEFKKILVLELPDAIDYCVNAYKKETIMEFEDDGKEEERDGRPKREKKEKPAKSKKDKDKKGGKKGDVQTDEKPKIEHANKTIQTPKIFPGEQVQFSAHAELGRIAVEEMSNGKVLTPYLIVSMVIEYLKSQPDIDGWVLINYPTNMEETVLFEEGLSGMPIFEIEPSNKFCKSLIDIVYICEQDAPEKEDERRFSKILMDPTEPTEPPSYETVLTAFINICADDEAQEDTESLAQEGIKEYQTLQSFYTDMGCYYSLYYKTFDYSTVKELCKLIIGEFSIPPKSSIEYFGEIVRYIEEEKLVDFRNSKFLQAEDKAKKEKGTTKKKSSEKGKKGTKIKKEKEKKGKTNKKGAVIVFEEKSAQIPEALVVRIEEKEVDQDIKAGEPGWEYLNLMLPEKIGSVVTDFWEHMEGVFMKYIIEVLYMKNTLLKTFMPYIGYATSFMTKHIIKSDERQINLAKFQEYFNQFDDDFRRENDFKSELRCLIYELKNKLLDICDKKMMSGEQERRSLIHQSWGPRHLIEIVNNSITGFQLELDRHIDTLMFINDYFIGIITETPSLDEIIKDKIPKLELEDKTVHKLINDFLLKTTEADDNTRNKIKDTLGSFYSATLEICKERQRIIFDDFNKVKLIFTPEANKQVLKTKTCGKGGRLQIIEPGNIIKKNKEKIFAEWSCALKGEVARLKIRFELLKHDMYQHADQCINTLKKMFYTMFDDIRRGYQKEIDCINKACFIFLTAVDKEVPIPDEQLFVDDECLMSVEIFAEPAPEVIVEPLSADLVFTLKQLKALTDIFFDLAQDGFILKSTFTFIIQDIILPDGFLLAPSKWTKLNGYNVNELIQRLFDGQKYIHWKDFIVYNLPATIPTDQDIINLKNQFLKFDPNYKELVRKEDYENVHFWFDDECTINEAYLIKNLLYRMYQKDAYCNYTAMLLDLCKGENVQEGVGKALAFICGHAVCWNDEIGKKFIEETFEKRRIHEEVVQFREKQLRSYIEFAETIIDSIIDTTVHACDSVVITEIPIEEEDDQKRKIKKGKIYSKDSDTSVIPTTNESEYIKPQPTFSTNDLARYTSSKIIETKDIEDGSRPSSSEPHITDRHFSNVAVGFERQTSPPLKYFLLFEDVANVLINALSDVLSSEDRHFFDTLCDIYQSCKNTDFNGEVLCHEFLNSEEFLELMKTNTKFVYKSPGRIVKDMLIKLEM